MIFGEVAGTVVGTQRGDTMRGARHLLIRRCSHTGKSDPENREYLVVLDALGAGPGEIVLVSQGSSARQTELSDGQPIDAIVIGLVDLVEARGEIVFRK
jgi:microcompartment protein CcmK/EutM